MNIAFIGMACALGLSAMGSAFGSGFAAQASVGAWKKSYANGKPAPLSWWLSPVLPWPKPSMASC